MAYYLRALLTDWEPRPLGDLLEYSEAGGCALRPEEPGVQLGDATWTEATLVPAEGGAPIEVEIAVKDGPGDALLREELEELADELEEAGGSRRARKKAMAHLERTVAIVAVRVSTASDDALDRAGAAIAYYVDRSGAMVHADGEGFYEGRRLLVATA